MGDDESRTKRFVQHWTGFAAAFVQSIQANGLLSEFVANPAVTGAYAEAWVKSLVHSMLGDRFRISTGAVVMPSDRAGDLRTVPQCDVIIWDPTQFPALFETHGFALVPYHSVRALIEVKRVWGADLPEQIKKRRSRVKSKSVLGVVLQHKKRLFELPVTSNWPEWQSTKPDYQPICRLLDNDLQPATQEVLALIYFLAYVAGHRDPNERQPPGQRKQK